MIQADICCGQPLPKEAAKMRCAFAAPHLIAAAVPTLQRQKLVTAGGRAAVDFSKQRG
jgi:hypothetical protein